MENIAIYPGTFDPITNGHVDVIQRASCIFNKVIVAIAVNSKKQCLFNENERLDMAVNSLISLENVTVEITRDLIVSFAREKNASTIIRGLRAVSDFEYEFQIALMNRKLEPDIHTIFMMPHEKYTYLNSSIIRELSRYNQDISDFVPNYVIGKLNEKMK